VLRYRPPSFFLGLVVSIFTLAMMAFIWRRS